MSKATIISIMPMKFVREMNGHNPHWYEIPPVPANEVKTLVIDNTTSWYYVRDGESIQRHHLAYDVAKELIDTYLNAVPDVSGDAQPGIAYVEGSYSPEEVEDKLSDLLEELREKQINYFRILVDKADDSWTKHGQKRDITDPQRFAAERLNLKRDWANQNEKGVRFIDCPACTTKIKSSAVICPNCKVELKKDHQFTFAS